jgi:aminoglycoside phosphotransferase (APT) family kinase protein
MKSPFLDKPQAVRSGEDISNPRFLAFLNDKLSRYPGQIKVQQYPGGYSNLTYLIAKGPAAFVLRKPPLGANIKSAHDMSREYRVLSLLKPVYDKIPAPLFLYEDNDLLGSPFYLMERVEGLILRNRLPDGLKMSPAAFKALATNAIDNLVALHKLDIEKTGLITLGKPEGYVHRQVEGWVRRYFNAETEEIAAMNETALWMKDNIPPESSVTFIHNDYKYDNLVFDPETMTIKALLDWEMATVGDPLMDLGTTLGYWAEADDHPALKAYSLTAHEGNLNRQEVADRYALMSGINMDHIVFYYVFGCFKIAVIAQQIYARYIKGLTKDPRFSGLIHIIKVCAGNAIMARRYQRLNNFK